MDTTAKKERARKEAKEDKEGKAKEGKEAKAKGKEPLIHQKASKRQETDPERVARLR
jgi:hypothetical protein